MIQKLIRFSLFFITAIILSILFLSPTIPFILSVQAESQMAWTTYKDSINSFLIQYPGNWQIQQYEPAPNQFYLITLWSEKPILGVGTAPRFMIKTEVVLEPITFQNVVSNSNRTTGDDSRIIKKGNLTLGGKKAFRIWTTDSSFDFPDSIITIIQYSDTQTITLLSFYTASNPKAVEIMQRLHGSLRILN